MDKKSNMEYWDKLEEYCKECLVNILSAAEIPVTITEDEAIDISKIMLETMLDKLKTSGIDTDKAYPYVDSDY